MYNSLRDAVDALWPVLLIAFLGGLVKMLLFGFYSLRHASTGLVASVFAGLVVHWCIVGEDIDVRLGAAIIAMTGYCGRGFLDVVQQRLVEGARLFSLRPVWSMGRLTRRRNHTGGYTDRYAGDLAGDYTDKYADGYTSSYAGNGAGSFMDMPVGGHQGATDNHFTPGRQSDEYSGYPVHSWNEEYPQSQGYQDVQAYEEQGLESPEPLGFPVSPEPSGFPASFEPPELPKSPGTGHNTCAAPFGYHPIDVVPGFKGHPFPPKRR